MPCSQKDLRGSGGSGGAGVPTELTLHIRAGRRFALRWKVAAAMPHKAWRNFLPKKIFTFPP